MSDKIYDFAIIGAGIAGCCSAYYISKETQNIIVLDKNSNTAAGASGAAGAFLNPILGKPNTFKELVTKALNFSVDFYSSKFSDLISSCGTYRVAKNDEDMEKFWSYEEFIEFDYEKKDDGYLFPIGSVVNSVEICNRLLENITQVYNYNVKSLEKKDNCWLINNDLKAKNIVLTTGANIDLISEDYVNIRPVWGQKINVYSSSEIEYNFHKECSISQSKKIKNTNKYQFSIGATHNRFIENMDDTSYNLNLKDINNISHNDKSLEIINKDTKKLINLANDILKLEDLEVIDFKIGARAASNDYFPIVGKLIDSKKSIEDNPHILNGSHIKDENLSSIDNFYIINGVGGRGYVLSPYLARVLCDNIFRNKKIDSSINSTRLFKRWVKRLKNKGKK